MAAKLPADGPLMPAEGWGTILRVQLCPDTIVANSKTHVNTAVDNCKDLNSPPEILIHVRDYSYHL